MSTEESIILKIEKWIENEPHVIYDDFEGEIETNAIMEGDIAIDENGMEWIVPLTKRNEVIQWAGNVIGKCAWMKKEVHGTLCSDHFTYQKIKITEPESIELYKTWLESEGQAKKYLKKEEKK